MLGKIELSKRAVDVKNRRLDDEVFFEERKRILGLWPTGKVLPVRDVAGAVRYVDCGNLPFTKEMREAQRHMIEERKRVEKVESDFALLLKDSLAFAKPLEEIEESL